MKCPKCGAELDRLECKGCGINIKDIEICYFNDEEIAKISEYVRAEGEKIKAAKDMMSSVAAKIANKVADDVFSTVAEEAAKNAVENKYTNTYEAAYAVAKKALEETTRKAEDGAYIAVLDELYKAWGKKTYHGEEIANIPKDVNEQARMVAFESAREFVDDNALRVAFESVKLIHSVEQPNQEDAETVRIRAVDDTIRKVARNATNRVIRKRERLFLKDEKMRRAVEISAYKAALEAAREPAEKAAREMVSSAQSADVMTGDMYADVCKEAEKASEKVAEEAANKAVLEVMPEVFATTDELFQWERAAVTDYMLEGRAFENEYKILNNINSMKKAVSYYEKAISLGFKSANTDLKRVSKVINTPNGANASNGVYRKLIACGVAILCICIVIIVIHNYRISNEDDQYSIDESGVQGGAGALDSEQVFNQGIKTCIDYISSGKNDFYLYNDGTVSAVGDDEFGMCTDVEQWKNIVGIDANDAHVVGLKIDGTVVAAGLKSYNRCEVSDWKNIKEIKAGYNCTVGLCEDGTVVVTNAESGNVDIENISAFTDVLQIEIVDWGKNSQIIGLKKDGTIVCSSLWYENELSGLSDIVSITTYDYALYGLKSDGTVLCYKESDYHPGDEEVADWTNIKQLAAGAGYIVGLKNDGLLEVIGLFGREIGVFSEWTDIVSIKGHSNGDVILGKKEDGSICVAGGNFDYEKAIGEGNDEKERIINLAGWGPERVTYTNEHPADHAVFNSITNNAAVGDERDFVRISEKNSGVPYSSDIYIEPNKQYEVYIYYHNNSASNYNDKDHDYVGVARETRLSTNFPDRLSEGESSGVWAKITSTTTEPSAVWDGAAITAASDMTLHYVTGSAKIYNSWGANGAVLSTSIFSEKGTFIGLNELNGLILGGDKYSGYITYTIQTKAIEN